MYMFWPAPGMPRRQKPHMRLSGSCSAFALHTIWSSVSAGFRPLAS